MTPVGMRRLGASIIGLAILAMLVSVVGLLGYIPKFAPRNSFTYAALLFAIVGRRLYRRGSATPS